MANSQSFTLCFARAERCFPKAHIRDRAEVEAVEIERQNEFEVETGFKPEIGRN